MTSGPSASMGGRADGPDSAQPTHTSGADMPRRQTTVTATQEEPVADNATSKQADDKTMGSKPLEELPVRFKQSGDSKSKREFVAKDRETVIRLDASEDWERA